MTTTDQTTSQDQLAARIASAAAVPQRIVEAWRAHDATAFAEVFTADGTMVLPGTYQKGREAITGFMTQAFAGPYKGSQVMGTPCDVKVLGPNVAVLVTEGGVAPAGASEVPEDARVRATWVLVHDATGWQLASYSNTPR